MGKEKGIPIHAPLKENDDTGLIFVLWPASKLEVHKALGLPSMAHLNPPVQQGATTEQSVSNLYAWLDNMSTGLGLAHSIAVASSNNRIPGVFDHVSKAEEQRFLN